MNLPHPDWLKSPAPFIERGSLALAGGSYHQIFSSSTPPAHPLFSILLQ